MNTFKHLLFTTFVFFFANILITSAQNEQWKALGTAQLSTNCLRGSLGLERLLGSHLGVEFALGMDLVHAEQANGQAMERGIGGVATTGIRYYMGRRHSGVFAGLDMAVSYKKFAFYANRAFAERSKTVENTVVLLPAVRFGYAFESDNYWNISPMLGLQYQLNLTETQSELQEGIFPFVGLQVGYSF